MAFFSMFLIWLFVFLFIAGIAGVVCGVIGLIISSNKRRAGTPLPKVLNVIFSITLSIGIAIAMIPVTIFVGIFVDSIVSGVDGEDFVQTDITIEETGYQDERFTADGVVYESLDFMLNYEEEVAEVPMFSYKEDGLFGMFAGGYYYLVENEHGFDLVSDEFGNLFCPASEKEEITEYYTDPSNINIYYNDWDGGYYRLKETEKNNIAALLNFDFDSLPKKTILLSDDEEFYIEIISTDKLLYVFDNEFVVFNGALYYVHEWDVTGDEDVYKYTMSKLPDDIAEKILEIHKNAEDR